MTVITTSTAATATAYSNQRKIDRTSNGVLWAMFDYIELGSTAYALMYYSTDNGATWNNGNSPVLNGSGGTSNAYVDNGSLFIDQDDYAHVVFKDKSNGYIYYRRGTPNAGRTAWTWSSAFQMDSFYGYNYPDIVAHREGTGWKVHIVTSGDNSAAYDSKYWPLTITSGGAVSLGATHNLIVADAASPPGLHKYPSIDFHHTGDGKTIKGGTPHLYVAWSAGGTGTNRGIRFKKATYSGGSWTWGTEQQINQNQFINIDEKWMVCLFDGTRVIIGGFLRGSDSSDYYMIYERDVADTTTTVRTLAGPSAPNRGYGSMSYDDEGNIYIVSKHSTNLSYEKWSRATASLGAATIVSNSAAKYVSAKRGYSNQRIEFIYTDGTASPYNITYDSITLNAPPSATITQPVDAIDPRVSNTVAWNYSDPEGSPQASYSAIVQSSAPEPTSYISGPTLQTGTIETYTVPMDGIYTIEAIGSKGGDSSEGNSGGKGARVVGEFSLTAGETLKVIAGKPGQKPTESTRGGGGGGASWVYKTGAAQPMIAAGGGGGGGNYTYAPNTQDASITTAGRNGTVSGAVGGTGGNGGNANTYASGGAGWLTNGQNNSSSFTTGGATPANGAAGGNAYSTSNAWGGFGGGGGAYAGAGGGAGYSGGGAGGWSNAGHGGGGGSYNAGTNQIMEEGVGTGEGVVNIYMNSEIMFTTSGTTETSFVLPADTLNDEEEYVLELTVSDGQAESTTTEPVLTDSWNYESEVVSSTQSGNLDISLIDHGESVEIQVATSDAVGFGPWSSTVTHVNNNIPGVVPSEYANVFNSTDGVVKWTYEDADGDAQTAYQIRVRKKI